MTCIAGAIGADGTVWMGADGVSGRNDTVRLGARAKVFHRGEFLMGSTGTLRVGQILEHLFQPPPIKCDLDTYMIQFANSLRAAVKEHGGESESELKSVEADGNFLVAVRGRLFEIDSGYGVFAPATGYHAVGCADQEAIVAMFMVKSLFPDSFSAEQMVRWGLTAAAEFDMNIRQPFTVLKSKPRNVSKKSKRQ